MEFLQTLTGNVTSQKVGLSKKRRPAPKKLLQTGPQSIQGINCVRAISWIKFGIRSRALLNVIVTYFPCTIWLKTYVLAHCNRTHAAAILEHQRFLFLFNYDNQHFDKGLGVPVRWTIGFQMDTKVHFKPVLLIWIWFQQYFWFLHWNENLILIIFYTQNYKINTKIITNFVFKNNNFSLTEATTVQ